MNFSKIKALITEQKKRRHFSIIISSLIVFAIVASLLVFELTKKEITVVLDGKKQEMKTHAQTVGDLLKDLNIQYKPYDQIEPETKEKITDQMQVFWKPAKKVVMMIDDSKEEVWTTADNVGDFLEEKGLEVNEFDKLALSKDTLITDGLEIKLDVAFKLVFNDGGKKKEVWSTSTTVADFLKHQGVQLNKLDRVEPDLYTLVKKGSNVKVIRVEKVTDVVEEPIDFAVVTKKDNSILKGNEKIVQEGKKGVLQKKYEVILENGKVVSKKLISENVIKNSTDKIVAVGTKVIQTVSRGKAQPGQEYYVTATAYTPQCNGCSGYSATGINLKQPGLKIIAVDPKFIPLGTKVWVEGYGYAIAGDTGGSIKGAKIDVLFQTKKEAYRWGVKKVKIRIIK
ncbi:G5 and 3D domain-containing protein [Bacillus kwashiorkori]|uniref:G5 and 3D domain-containing protein n=1 Tax=Bacillus kwashiorkori TaxID=1522318 RepID=UPI000A7AF20F|nr:G5 and 3D domain-containing protein [Bacillus kwashiorkori]